MKTKKIFLLKVQGFSIYIVLFFLFFTLLSYDNVSKAEYLCGNVPGPGLWYDLCGATDVNTCVSLDVTFAGCTAGWSCATPNCLAACNFNAGVTCATATTACISKYAACGCTCGSSSGGSGGLTTGCIGGASGDSDGDGDFCDPGETMFNCTPDCLPAGIPTKSIEDVLDDIIGWLLGFGLLIATTFLVWGGVNYVASSGDAQKTENAKKIIKYSLLGVIVIGFSYAAIAMLDVIFS